MSHVSIPLAASHHRVLAGPQHEFVLDKRPEASHPIDHDLGQVIRVQADPYKGTGRLQQVPDEPIMDRMTGRRSCPECGAVYHVVNLKPKTDGQCDTGCGALTQRKDDTPEVVSYRLKTYHEQTAAVVGYYQGKGNTILDIDANQDIDKVTASVLGKLDALNG